jgi:hypothetical protein
MGKKSKMLITIITPMSVGLGLVNIALAARRLRQK